MMLMLVMFVAAAAGAARGGTIGDITKSIQKEVVAVATPIESTLVNIGSSQCSHVKKLIGVSYEQLDDEKEPDLNKLQLDYIDEKVRVIYNIATAADDIVKSPEYNRHKKLYLYIHGFTDNPTKASFGNISSVLLKGGESNVLALDGSSLINGLFLRSSTYVRFMGEKLGQVLSSMVHDGVDPASIHVIGHSLGAHVAGFTGKEFTRLTGQRLGRLSCLDPAGPCFSHVDDDLRLNSTDASFVDCIHTDAGVYGLTDPVGQVDYYPNSGGQQPNCQYSTSSRCSHSRAWVYFVESVVNKQAFPAVRCDSWDDFMRGKCDKEISYMGFPSKPGTTGKFYLQTSGETPFGLGMNGTTFNNNLGIVRNIGSKFKDLFG